MSLALSAIEWALLSMCLPLVNTAHAQQQLRVPIDRPPLASQASEVPTVHVEARLVSLALNVVDQQGAPVPGLDASDFELAEDNRLQRIAFFESESTTPLEIVLAIDASESVFPDDRLERDAARSFVKSLLRPQDRIELMAFSDDVDELVPFTNDPKRIDSGLGRIRHGHATALYDAIDLASQRLAEAPSPATARRVVVLITDGENTTRHGSYAAALDQAERAGAMICSLIVVPVEADAGRNTAGEHALIQLASDTGGKFYYIVQESGLTPALQHVSGDLRTQYTVGYYAPRHGPDAPGLRHIHLQLKDPALRARYTLRYRTAYYASR